MNTTKQTMYRPESHCGRKSMLVQSNTRRADSTQKEILVYSMNQTSQYSTHVKARKKIIIDQVVGKRGTQLEQCWFQCIAW